MVAYQLEISSSAEKELKSIHPKYRGLIVGKLLRLESNPFPAGIKRLFGSNNFRVRIGDYRAIYSVNNATKKIIVLAVGHRKDIYR